MDYRNSYDNCLGEGTLVALSDAEIACVAGGQSIWYQMGHSLADGYQWAREKTADFYEWLLG